MPQHTVPSRVSHGASSALRTAARCSTRHVSSPAPCAALAAATPATPPPTTTNARRSFRIAAVIAARHLTALGHAPRAPTALPERRGERHAAARRDRLAVEVEGAFNVDRHVALV